MPNKGFTTYGGNVRLVFASASFRNESACCMVNMFSRGKQNVSTVIRKVSSKESMEYMHKEYLSTIKRRKISYQWQNE